MVCHRTKGKKKTAKKIACAKKRKSRSLFLRTRDANLLSNLQLR